jgi:hypothetical protein
MMPRIGASCEGGVRPGERPTDSLGAAETVEFCPRVYTNDQLSRQTDAHKRVSPPVGGLPRPIFRVPTSQERADELLMRWRLERAAGIPAERRLEEDAR